MATKLPDDAALQEFFGNVFKDLEEPHITVLERSWYRNILYYMGEQWLQWLDTPVGGTFGYRFGFNVGVPTPVSNIIRDYVKSVKALFLNKQYTASVWPNSMDREDKDASEIGQDALKWLNIRNEGEIEDIKELLVMWIALTGNGWTRTFADRFGSGFVLDAKGNAISKADVAVDITLPFNIRVAPLGVRLKQKRWVGCKSLVYKEWAEDIYKVKLDGANVNSRQMDYQKQLLSLVANVSPWKGRGLAGTDSMSQTPSDELIVINEVEWKPDEKFPEGRYAAMAGDKKLVHADHLPIPVKNGVWFYTFDHFVYNHTPGGFWGSGGVDDLISPQNTINEVDQALAINRKTTGRPFIITPSNLTLKRMSEKGQALLAVQYDASSALGQKVIVHQGTPYPQQVMDERAVQKEVAQEAGGDPKNVLRGKTPYAGAPGVAIDILRETAEQSHAPDVRRFYRTWNRVERKQLILVADLYKETRLIKVKGKGNLCRIRKFKGADLHGNLDVQLELDSGLSSTNIGKNQFMMQLIQYGFWDPMRGPKPDVRRELLRRFGMAGFPEESNLHMDRAEYENSVIVAGGTEAEDIALPPMETDEVDPETGQPMIVEQDDPVFELDDHYSHIQVHDQLIFSREFKALSDEKKMMAILHREYHAAKLTEQVTAEQTMKMGQEGAQSVREQVAGEEGLEGPEGPQAGAGGGPGGGQVPGL